MLAFIGLLIVLVAIYIYFDSAEGFDAPPKVTSYKVNVPSDAVVSPAPAPSGADVKPSILPGQLPSAPYQEIARANPRVYRDPALQKTNRTRILNALETVKGFLAFEAQELEGRSDPAVQLPLTTLRGDFARLEDEARVLQRNPGLEPDMTELAIAEIESNLAYLQRQVRLTGMARPFGDYAWDRTAVEGFEAAGEASDASSQPATKSELQQFSQRISAEMQRLSASGTDDPLIAQRISILNAMKVSVDGTIASLESGDLKPEDVAIKSSDISNALLAMNSDTQISTEIQSAFFSNTSDPQLNAMIQSSIDKYMEDIIKGSSLNIQYTYISPRETIVRTADAVKALAESSVASTGFPSTDDLAAVSGNTVATGDPFTNVSAPFADAPRPIDRRAIAVVGSTAAHFDWKARAEQITAQIKKRGLNAADFGVMPAGTKVSDDFGWRGYVRMICTRLQATPDPGLPETCGCPPLDWAGWRTFN